MIGEISYVPKYSVFVGCLSLDQCLVKANVMLYSEIDEGEDVIGQRGARIDSIFYLITSE